MASSGRSTAAWVSPALGDVGQCVSGRPFDNRRIQLAGPALLAGEVGGDLRLTWRTDGLGVADITLTPGTTPRPDGHPLRVRAEISVATDPVVPQPGDQPCAAVKVQVSYLEGDQQIGEVRVTLFGVGDVRVESAWHR